MKIVQDTIHGAIKLEDWMLKIIDTPQFQRLRRIKQLGFANLVYPGANHTRFEHSLGTVYLALRLKERIEIDDHVLAAALLHDIAHPPFSHSSEALLEKFSIRHEDVKFAIKGEIKDVLDELGLKTSRISEIVSGKERSIVNGDVDVDKMDYLVRDSYYTGVAYGIIDLERLVNKIKFEGEVLIEEGGLKAVEALLISRYMMYSTVYYHHVCRIAKKMYEKAMLRIIERGFDAKNLIEMDDCEAMMLMKREEREFYDMLVNRRLFKRAVYVGKSSLNFEEIKVKEEEAEREIAEKAGVDEKYVLVDIPKEDVKEFKVKVEVDGKVFELEALSPLVKILKTAIAEDWKIGVYTKKEFLDRVSKAAIDYFGIKH
ncbi:MAG: HD domain-containing protein [Archaeoglobaceae archaeon]|nr:HD domain-containing protein [Archaeoglobaceae archaeon]